MKNSFFKSILMGGFLAAAAGLSAQDKDHGPTPYALPSQMQTHLRVDVKEDTKELHIVQDDNDPDIITKAYVLKHADPYELRPYIRMAVRSERIKGDNTKVECIKYNDGTGILIVSAEDYRFGKQENGIGFDEMIQMLDIPNITSSSGSVSLVYFPKYHDAKWLADKIKHVGTNVSGDDKELSFGRDKIVVDNGLNGLLFYIPRYSYKNISEMLKTFDTPIPEVRVKYTVYELNHEDDGTLGVDFQAWKNGPGSDIFSVAHRFTDGWDVMKNITKNSVGDTRTQFFKFSPRWNTKFLDFLAVKGKASVITSGELSVLNNREGRIESTTRIAGFRDGAKFANIETFAYYQIVDSRIYNAYSGPPQDDQNDGRWPGRFRLSAWDDNGNLISISTRANQAVQDPLTNDNSCYRGDLTITRVFDGNRYYYGLILDEAEAREQQVQFVMQRRDSSTANTGNVQNFHGLGYRVEGLANVKLERTEIVTAEIDPVTGNQYTYRHTWSSFSIPFNTSESDTIYRDVARNTAIDGYGFVLSMKPSVCEETTLIDLHMTNTSLLGFNDAGTPRTARSEVQNKFMISNKGGRLVVGGVDKHSVVKSVSKVPYLGDLPILGYLLSSESAVTKKSQVVAVLDCESVMPDSAVPQNASDAISELKGKLDEAGDSNTYGFDQLWLDKDKKGFDPLP